MGQLVGQSVRPSVRPSVCNALARRAEMRRRAANVADTNLLVVRANDSIAALNKRLSLSLIAIDRNIFVAHLTLIERVISMIRCLWVALLTIMSIMIFMIFIPLSAHR